MCGCQPMCVYMTKNQALGQCPSKKKKTYFSHCYWLLYAWKAGMDLLDYVHISYISLCVLKKSQISKMFWIKYSDFKILNYACSYVSVQVPTEARKGGQIPCAWSCELPSMDVRKQTSVLCKDRACFLQSHLSSPLSRESKGNLQSMPKATFVKQNNMIGESISFCNLST